MIIKNAIKCRKCGDVIESTSTHDLKICSCGAVLWMEDTNTCGVPRRRWMTSAT